MRRLVFALLCCAALLRGQDSRPYRAQALVESYREAHGVVGVAAAVVQDGRLLACVESGFADREAGRRVGAATWFRLGSISKPVTATAALKLVEAGTLRLDAPVTGLVPEWPADQAPITLRQLLSHTAGVRHYRPAGLGDPTLRVFAHYTTAEAVALFAGDALLFPPGTRESYSTHGYTLVARAVEVACGGELVAWLRAHVLAPELDCEVLAEARPERSALYSLATPKAQREARAEDNSWKYGGGGMEATARGLARWADALRAGQLLSAASLTQMWTPTTLSDGKHTRYGLGWHVAGARVSHTGAQQGCRSALLLDRDLRLAVVVLTNTAGSHAPMQLAQQLAALWAGR